MNRRFLLLLGFLCVFLGDVGAQTYCIPTFSAGSCTSSSQDYINSFSTTGGVSNISNLNSGCTNNANNYTFFSTMTCSQIQGLSVNFSIVNTPSWGEGQKIWVDWNQDGDFVDPGELVYSPTTTAAAGATATGSFTVPVTATVGTTRMRVMCVYANTTFISCDNQTYGETEDYNFTVIATTPCSGAPTIGTASSSPDSVCPGTAFTVSLSSPPAFSGITYQWQSGTSAAGPWTNITGATGATYTSTGITATSYYRVTVSCGTNTTISNVVTVFLKPFIKCYCNTSAATYNGDDDIGRVVVGTFSNPTVAPTPLTNNSASVNTYSNFTTLTPIPLNAGVSTPISVTQINQYGYYTCYLKVYIDYNHNGLLTDAGEQVFAANGPGAAANPTFSGNFTVPTTALSGLTLMRFVLVESGSSSSVTPCGTYAWGETEDYYVNILGAPTVTTNSPVCNNGTLTITATSTAASPTYNFSGPGITATSNTTGILNVPNVTSANAGAYSVTVTSGSYTSIAATTNVTITPATVTTVSTITAPTTCGGTNGSLQISGLLANTSYVLNYTKNSVAQTALTLTSNASGIITIPNLSSATYGNIIFAASSGGCSTAPLNQVTVPSPSAPATPTGNYNPPLCKGSNLTLTVNNPNGAGVYTWSGPTGFNSTGTLVTRNNLQLADSGDYLVSVTVANCVSAPGIVHVSITPPPPAPVTAAISYCQNEVAVPLTAIGQGLKFYDSLLSNTAYPSAPIPPTSVPGSRKYYVAQTINTCVGFRDSILVTIKPTPATPTAVTSYAYCQYEIAAPLTATGQLIKWYAAPTGGSALPAAPTPSTFLPGTLTYYVTQTVLGCESNRLPITILIKPKPAPPVVTTPVRYCQFDQAVPLTAGGTNLKWYENSVGGLGSLVAPTPVTSYEDTLTWWVTQTVNGCESDRSLISVTINAKPNGIIIASNPYVCQYDTTTFYYYGSARPSYYLDWKVPGISAEIVDSIAGNGLTRYGIRVRFDSAGSIPVRLQVNNNGCLSDEFYYSMQVRPVPVVRIETKNDVCINEQSIVSIDRASQTVDNYQWDFAGNQVLYGSEEGPYGIKWSTPGDFIISVIAGTNACPAKPVYDTIHVHDLPDASIGFMSEHGTICSGDSVFFQATTKQLYGDSASMFGSYTYRWLPVFDFRNADSTKDFAYGIIASAEPVRLQVVDMYGCVGTQTADLQAKPCCIVTLPNAFTPNYDGRNDKFHIITKGHQKIINFRIMNRWGKVVFESAEQNASWDGNTNGVPQEVGTYYYYVKYQCDDNSFYDTKGELTLIR